MESPRGIIHLTHHEVLRCTKLADCLAVRAPLVLIVQQVLVHQGLHQFLCQSLAAALGGDHDLLSLHELEVPFRAHHVQQPSLALGLGMEHSMMATVAAPYTHTGKHK